jgi:hypothetical protein
MAQGGNRVSPEVAKQLVDLAAEMRRLVFGGEGVPKWGTKFSEIESEALSVGQELSRLMMEQAVTGQVKQVPDESLKVAEETAGVIGTESAVLETPAGEVGWRQPKARLSKARRDFFPSGSSLGR